MKIVNLVALMVCGWLYASHADYRDAVERQKTAQVARDRAICPERDYLGRHLVASYHARSDTFQTKRCTYVKRISA